MKTRTIIIFPNGSCIAANFFFFKKTYQHTFLEKNEKLFFFKKKTKFNSSEPLPKQYKKYFK